jgi:hypothetical protein
VHSDFPVVSNRRVGSSILAEWKQKQRTYWIRDALLEIAISIAPTEAYELTHRISYKTLEAAGSYKIGYTARAY